MKQQMRHRLAWCALALAVIVVLFMSSGCAMFEEKMAQAKGLVGLGETEVIECTSNPETGCEGWVESGTTTE